MKQKAALTVEDMKGVKVLHLKGHLDLETAQIVKPQMLELAKVPRNRMVIDLENTSYISSFGLSLLLQVNDQVKAAGGRLALAAPHPFAKQVFDTTQLLSVFKFFDTIEAAVRALAGGE
jgi:anti-anti-sigma factor